MTSAEQDQKRKLNHRRLSVAIMGSITRCSECFNEPDFGSSEAQFRQECRTLIEYGAIPRIFRSRVLLFLCATETDRDFDSMRNLLREAQDQG